MYFTIPANYAGTGNSARTVYLDNGVSLQYTPTTLRYSFGEGYSLTLPTGPEKRTFTGVMSNRTKAEVDDIKNYFVYLNGQAINGFTILDTAANIKTTKFDVSWISLDTGTIQADFEEFYGTAQ